MPLSLGDPWGRTREFLGPRAGCRRLRVFGAAKRERTE
ncbi:hypothetical protein PY32053_02022 [Paracoccus yeei]|uniref:Uncharacterized protein n=1 Tax=Paracoccus yeei TaxID=147645 RepID=A0A386UME9_9RHOB|nr:hypothetical protein PY32053_02022 [Paracoccus yeei]